jgi:hypothetical protein
MKKVIVTDLDIAYLESRYPGQFVVRVKIDNFNENCLSVTRNIFHDIGFTVEEICDVINNGGIFLVARDEEEATEIFNMFNVEYAPYTYVWGLMKMLKIPNNIDPIDRMALEQENKKRINIMNKYPNGSVLISNV